jgi:hypothetical protein
VTEDHLDMFDGAAVFPRQLRECTPQIVRREKGSEIFHRIANRRIVSQSPLNLPFDESRSTALRLRCLSGLRY